MSKSTGNGLRLESLVAGGIRPVEVRYFLLAPHYRSDLDYFAPDRLTGVAETLRESAAGYRRLEGFVQRATERVGLVPAAPVPVEFAEAMDDDLNTARALAVLHRLVRDGYNLLSGVPVGDGDQPAETLVDVVGLVRGMLGVLGLDPLEAPWAGGGGGSDDRLRSAVDALVVLALEQRAAARTRKDWAAADAIRSQLRDAGIAVEDTPAGPRWTLGPEVTS